MRSLLLDSQSGCSEDPAIHAATALQRDGSWYLSVIPTTHQFHAFHLQNRLFSGLVGSQHSCSACFATRIGGQAEAYSWLSADDVTTASLSALCVSRHCTVSCVDGSGQGLVKQGFLGILMFEGQWAHRVVES